MVFKFPENELSWVTEHFSHYLISLSYFPSSQVCESSSRKAFFEASMFSLSLCCSSYDSQGSIGNSCLRFILSNINDNSLASCRRLCYAHSATRGRRMPNSVWGTSTRLLLLSSTIEMNHFQSPLGEFPPPPPQSPSSLLICLDLEHFHTPQMYSLSWFSQGVNHWWQIWLLPDSTLKLV